MKLTTDRPYSAPNMAARRIVEIASTVDPVQHRHIHIELVKPVPVDGRGQPRGVRRRHKLALERGSIVTNGHVWTNRTGALKYFREQPGFGSGPPPP